MNLYENIFNILRELRLGPQASRWSKEATIVNTTVKNATVRRFDPLKDDLRVRVRV